MRKITFFILLVCLFASCSTVMLTVRKQLLLVSNADVLTSSFHSHKQFIDFVPTSKDIVNIALVKTGGQKISTAVKAYFNANGISA